MHVVTLNTIYMQLMSVHKSLLGRLNVDILYCIFLHILTLMHVYMQNKMIIGIFIVYVSNILSFKENSDVKNRSLGSIANFKYTQQ